METLILESLKILGLPGAVVAITAFVVRQTLLANEKKNHVISHSIVQNTRTLVEVRDALREVRVVLLELRAEFAESRQRR